MNDNQDDCDCNDDNDGGTAAFKVSPIFFSTHLFLL